MTEDWTYSRLLEPHYRFTVTHQHATHPTGPWQFWQTTKTEGVFSMTQFLKFLPFHQNGWNNPPPVDLRNYLSIGTNPPYFGGPLLGSLFQRSHLRPRTWSSSCNSIIWSLTTTPNSPTPTPFPSYLSQRLEGDPRNIKACWACAAPFPPWNPLSSPCLNQVSAHSLGSTPEIFREHFSVLLS